MFIAAALGLDADQVASGNLNNLTDGGRLVK
jgi:hypothetical protein